MAEETGTHTEVYEKWKEMTLALIERRLRDFLAKTRKVEALLCVMLPKEKPLSEIRDCFRGARYSVRNAPRYWGLAEELVFEAKEWLEKGGYSLPEG
ncbi:hypothetical protein AKJ66_01550 [candidate division MSBL1 archaeon SCGC-AAA259E22]|uniref:Uncharacterized protein n=1 Tax=candidate division MSBL1 archaeon SCGC-AAA259E22 TaxID=1698265 RepID=A0A133UHM6_9EURY|nr:hypothetical protein AKJ66_01550 [candidate division MSBL1 archaeon SCGC-AAA259E22]